MNKRKRISKLSGVLLLVILLILIFFNKTVSDHRKQLTIFESDLDSIVANYEEMVLMLSDRNKDLVDENTKLKEIVEDAGKLNYTLSKDEIYLLAQCAEAEAGHYENHSLSQQYVTQVILNRVHSDKFPNSIKEVIYESHNGIPQFSVAYNGMIDREVTPETLANVYKVVMHGTDLPEYVCYFYSTIVKDNWVNELPIYKTVEGTVFAYSEEDFNEKQ